MRATRRVKLGAGAAAGVLVLLIGAAVALAGGGGSEGDDPAAAAARQGPEDDGRERTTATTAGTSTTTPTVPTITTVAPAPPTTTDAAPQPDGGDRTTAAPRPRPPVVTVPPLPPPPAPAPTAWVDTPPRAVDWSASCETTGPTTVTGTARVMWSDGFVDEFTATYTSPGQNQNASGGRRGWTVIVDVWPPPQGAIGDYYCNYATVWGPIYWDG